ncbi:MAG: pseudouridine synthase [Rhizobiales bacterium]|nr:pseudouridine synthase [Rhizobacter sp.]
MKPRRALPLPTRNGVGPSCVALPAGPWPTIAAFLAQRFPTIAASVWAERIAGGEVVDEHGIAVTPTRAHQPQLRIYYYRSLADEPRVPFDEVVLFQDAHIVVADKPHFLAVTPSGDHLHETLLVRLKRKLGIDTLTPVHRIDRETAGLVLFSIDPATRGAYQRVFAERAVQKEYECIAPWRAEIDLPLVRRSRLADDPSHFMRVCEVSGEPNAQTRIELVDRVDDAARYRLTPLTGHRHQLRVHCAALSMPIRGDRIYPALLPAHTDDHANPLQLLARSLAFVDPVTGAARRFESGFRLQTLADHQ